MVAIVSHGWKLALTVLLIVVVLLSVFARAPRNTIAARDLRQLILVGAALYAVGAVASLMHRGGLAGGVYATGILVCSVAVWLSRGIRPDDGPDGGSGNDDDGPPRDLEPPPDPDDAPSFDWDEFEREFADYSRPPAHR